MKLPLFLGLSLISGFAQATQLYDNGQVVDENYQNIAGAFLAVTSSTIYFARTVAEDFTITTNSWNVDSIDFYGGEDFIFGAPVFSMKSVTWRIVRDDPSSGDTVASGLTAVSNGGLLGFIEAPGFYPNQNDPIYDLHADIGSVDLGPGHYWLTWSYAGSRSVPYTPVVYGHPPGNAMTERAGRGAFVALDNEIDDTGVALPFTLNGTVMAVPEPATSRMLAVGLGVLALVGIRGRRKTVCNQVFASPR